MVETVVKSPLPTILGIGGVVFLFLALVGRMGGKVITVVTRLGSRRAKTSSFWVQLATFQCIFGVKSLQITRTA